MSVKYTGIDIGTCYIKIAEIKVGKRHITINKPQVVRTPGMLVQGGRLAAAGELMKLLGELLHKGRYCRKCVIILNDSIAITRDMELPSAKPHELERMIRLDASEYLPFGVDQYTIRYKIIVPDKLNPRKNNYILLSAVKNDLLMDFIGVFSKSGLKPVAIDTSFNCMSKYLQWAYFTPEKKEKTNTAFLDFGAGGARLIITRNGVPCLHQPLNCSSQKLDVIISNTLDINRSEAEEQKIWYGLSYNYGVQQDEAYRPAGVLINQQIDLLMGDMYKYFQSFSSRNNGETVNEIRMTGGMAEMKNLDRYLGDAFSVPCTAEMQGKKVICKNAAGTGFRYPLFTNLIGAALRSD